LNSYSYDLNKIDKTNQNFDFLLVLSKLQEAQKEKEGLGHLGAIKRLIELLKHPLDIFYYKNPPFVV